MPNLGPLELLVIFVVALVVFGPTKLPEIGRQVGRAVREFRRIQSSFQTDLNDVLEDRPPGPPSPDRSSPDRSIPDRGATSSAPTAEPEEAAPPRAPAAETDDPPAPPTSSGGGPDQSLR